MTGASFPPELLTRDGTCTQCGRVGRTACTLWAGSRKAVHPCAECLTDLVSGTAVLAGSTVWAEIPGTGPSEQPLTVKLKWRG